MINDLPQWVSGFLRRRCALKHFGRHPMLETLGGRGLTEAAPEHLARDLLLVACDDLPAAMAASRPMKTG